MCQSVVTLKIQCLHLNHQNLARKLGDVHLAITMTILGRARCPGPATLAAFRQLERKRHGHSQTNPRLVHLQLLIPPQPRKKGS